MQFLVECTGKVGHTVLLVKYKLSARAFTFVKAERKQPTYSPTYSCSFFSSEQDEKLFWQMAFGDQRINLVNFTEHVGKISSWQFFHKTLCAGDFLLGAQRLVKSTPGVRSY